MKRSKKWFIVCLTLSALVAPYLLTSSDASALKYAYNAFPLYQSNVLFHGSGYSSWNPTFEASFDTTDQNNTSFDDDILEGQLTPIRVDNNVCFDDDNNEHSIFAVTNSSSYHQLNFWTGEGNGFYKTIDDLSACHQHNIRKYAYDSVYTTDYNMTTGDAMKLVNIPNLFFDWEDPMFDNGSIKRLTLPLNISDSNVGTIPANTPIKWKVGVVQDGANGFPYLDSNMNYEMQLKYVTSSNLQVSVTVPSQNCTLDTNYHFRTLNEEEGKGWLGFGIECSYTPDTDMRYISAQLVIWGGSSKSDPDPFLTYDFHSPHFSGSYLITNNDETWSGLTANDAPDGYDLQSAPGYHQLYGYPDQEESACTDGDFLCELSNLFSFDVLNPFRPIFDLFVDQNSCQQIPIIAGMIHSQETQVCPWFAPSTRNIVTPVLGIASIMLLFGFIVRWLGARSGNFFEDTTDGHDVGSIHVGRRNKK